MYQKNNGIRSWYATVKEKGEGREREREKVNNYGHIALNSLLGIKGMRDFLVCIKRVNFNETASNLILARSRMTF